MDLGPGWQRAGVAIFSKRDNGQGARGDEELQDARSQGDAKRQREGLIAG